MTITIKGMAPLTLSFTGTFTPSATSAVKGVFSIQSILEPTAAFSTQGFSMTGTLSSGGSITVTQLSVFSHPTPGTGYMFNSPAPMLPPIVLNRITAVA
jgi:hypothetical protein